MPRSFRKKGDKRQIKKVREQLRFARTQLHTDYMNCSCNRCQTWHHRVEKLQNRLDALLEDQIVDFDDLEEKMRNTRSLFG